MMREIYLDNNATTQVLPQACVAMLEVMGTGFGNPSSAHRSGEKTRRVLFAARVSTSKLFGCLPENILFGSGATELNNWILTGLCQKPDPHLITSEVEHSSVLRVADQLATKGVRVTYLPVDRQGLIDLDELKESIAPRTSLVSIQWANGETGVIQDIDSIASICSARGVKLHCDATQAIGKFEFDVVKVPVDFVTCSARIRRYLTGAYLRKKSFDSVQVWVTHEIPPDSDGRIVYLLADNHDNFKCCGQALSQLAA